MSAFTVPDFLDRDECHRIRAAMDRAPAEPGEVLGDSVEHLDDVRRVASLEVEAAVVTFVERRLDAQREAVAGFFGLALSAREGSGFLRYTAGGFYAPHRDRGDAAAWPGAARRRVALVAFLNDSTVASPHGGFAGGNLRLLTESGPAVEIAPRQGMLVAFSADALHEVTPVETGVRDVIVDWFY